MQQAPQGDPKAQVAFLQGENARLKASTETQMQFIKELQEIVQEKETLHKKQLQKAEEEAERLRDALRDAFTRQLMAEDHEATFVSMQAIVASTKSKTAAVEDNMLVTQLEQQVDFEKKARLMAQEQKNSLEERLKAALQEIQQLSAKYTADAVQRKEDIQRMAKMMSEDCNGKKRTELEKKFIEQEGLLLERTVDLANARAEVADLKQEVVNLRLSSQDMNRKMHEDRKEFQEILQLSAQSAEMREKKEKKGKAATEKALAELEILKQENAELRKSSAEMSQKLNQDQEELKEILAQSAQLTEMREKKEKKAGELKERALAKLAALKQEKEDLIQTSEEMSRKMAEDREEMSEILAINKQSAEMKEKKEKKDK
eukprot:gnl/MRDRNA2_/MRDRNA2_78432_c0_seq2.p2 gnl/MRDRNA2_/MRDRNA2_78432_c0~~gnl/MRDRNA2_/MRDRNA2_78432_c0_seq2.p2  ORF type:complete len:374 (+),score=148.25 gnl/MRDRNA2_/MRDRNA2_78432_c0_seq2:138-1259(+)